MYIKFTKPILFSLLIGLSLNFSGCGTLQLETNAKMTRNINLKPIEVNKNTVYISITNVNPKNFKIKELLESNLEASGYKIVESSDNAEHILLINILFAHNLAMATSIKDDTSFGLGMFNSTLGTASDTSISENIVASLLLGATTALASAAISKANSDEVYRAIVDVNIRQKNNDSNYKEHYTRVIAEAVQKNLKLDKVLPIMGKKAVQQISTIFKGNS